MKRIARILDHLRSGDLSLMQLSRNEAVELAYGFYLYGIVCPKHGKRRIEEVRHGRTFPQKLRIEADQKIASFLLPTRGFEGRNYDTFGCTGKDSAPKHDPMK